MATRYEPDAALGGRSVIVFVGAVAIAAAAAALGAHIMARSARLLLVLPAVQGVMVGAAARFAIRARRMHRPTYLATLAAVAAASAVVGHAVLDYADAKAQQVAECEEVRRIMGVAGRTARDGVNEEYAECVAEAAPARFLARRFGMEADLRNAGRGGLAIGTLELLLAMGVAALLTSVAAGEPACPRCGAWRKPKPLRRAAFGASGELVEKLLAGDAAGAAGTLDDVAGAEQTELTVLRCPEGHDRRGGVLRVVDWKRDRRGHVRPVKVADLVVSRVEVEALSLPEVEKQEEDEGDDA